MIQEKTRKESYIIWQEGTEDLPVPEQALLIESYNDIFSIQQEDRSININYDSIDGLIKLLKQIKKENL
jgi:hypothetical protein